MSTIDEFLADHGEELVAFRRRLHAHPECSWEEHETTAAVRDRLEVAGFTTRPLPTVETGLVADLGRDDGPTVLLRADIDALPLEDEKEVPYRSTVQGVCHACGHDVHTTVLLGAALALRHALDDRPGRIRLLFQPAEESVPGGARRLYDTSVMDDVVVAYGLHCDPGLEVGRVGLRVGAITSAADRLTIKLEGAGGHTARPHLTTDLVHVLGRLITELPAGLDKLTDSRDAASLVFGSVGAGVAPNVIPTHAELHGTLRVRGRASWDAAPAIVERLVDAIAGTYGAHYELDYQRGSPPVENDEQAVAVMTRAAQEGLGPDAVVPTEQSVGNEDFSWLLERAPGAYARLGVRSPETTRAADLHAGAFDVDERAIAVGVRLLVHTALEAIQAYQA